MYELVFSGFTSMRGIQSLYSSQHTGPGEKRAQTILLLVAQWKTYVEGSRHLAHLVAMETALIELHLWSSDRLD